MSLLSNFISCPAVQQRLDRVGFLDNLKMEIPGFLAYVLSPNNRMDVIQREINMRPGGRRSVEVVYGQRFLESMAEAYGRISCGSWSKDGETSTLYSIDPADGFRAGFQISTRDLEERCERSEDYIAERMMKLMDVLARRLATKLAIDALANTGNFASDVDAGNPAGTSAFKQGATKLGGVGGLSTDFLEVMRFEMQNNFEADTPFFAFGHELLMKYIASLQAATENNTQTGLAAGRYYEQSGVTLAHDRRIGTNATNANDVLATIPGAIQMISFNEFRSILEFESATETQGVIQHPNPDIPLSFDYRAKYTCNDQDERIWDFELAINADFIFAPNDMFQAGDRMEGVNGVNLFRIANP